MDRFKPVILHTAENLLQLPMFAYHSYTIGKSVTNGRSLMFLMSDESHARNSSKCSAAMLFSSVDIYSAGTETVQVTPLSRTLASSI